MRDTTAPTGEKPSNPSPAEHAALVTDIVARLDGLHLLAVEAVLKHVRDLIAVTVQVDATSPRARRMAEGFRRDMTAAGGGSAPGGPMPH